MSCALRLGGGVCPDGGQGGDEVPHCGPGVLRWRGNLAVQGTLRHRDPYPDSAKHGYLSRCHGVVSILGGSMGGVQRAGGRRQEAGSSTTTPPDHCETGESAAEDAPSVQRTTGTAFPRKGADQKGGGCYWRVSQLVFLHRPPERGGQPRALCR